MLKVGVMVSGGGTNLQAIIDGVHSGVITNAKLEVVISNKKDAYALTRAKTTELRQKAYAWLIMLQEMNLIRH